METESGTLWLKCNYAVLLTNPHDTKQLQKLPSVGGPFFPLVSYLGGLHTLFRGQKLLDYGYRKVRHASCLVQPQRCLASPYSAYRCLAVWRSPFQDPTVIRLGRSRIASGGYGGPEDAAGGSAVVDASTDERECFGASIMQAHCSPTSRPSRLTT